MPGKGLIEQIEVGDLVRDFRQMRIVAIGQNDDGKLFLRKPLDARGEADGVPAVPNVAQPSIFANKPAKPILDGLVMEC